MGDYCLIKVHCWRKQQYYNESFMKQLFMSLELYFEDYFKDLKCEKGINDHLYNFSEYGLRFNCIGDISRGSEHEHINKIISMAGDLRRFDFFDIIFINLEDDEISKFDALENLNQPKEQETKGIKSNE